MNGKIIIGISILLISSHGISVAMNTTLTTEPGACFGLVGNSVTRTPESQRALYCMAGQAMPLGSNRKQRREQGERSAFRTRVQESKIERISAEINTDVFNAGNLSFLPRFMHDWVVWSALQSSSLNRLMNRLESVNISLNEIQSQEEFSLLLKKNSHIDHLLSRVVGGYADNDGLYRFLAGSTIDCMTYSPQACTLFSQFNKFLDVYMTDKI